MAGALQRLTVVDLSSHLSGPYCAMLLADHGADVIKIEKPDGGEKPSAHWLAALDAAGIPAGPVLEFDQAMADRHIVARGVVVGTEHPAAGRVKTLGIPVKLSDTPGALRRPAPRLGEHTAEVLGFLNRDQQQAAAADGN